MDYDDWRLASPYDYETPSPSDDGYIHEDDIPCITCTKDLLEGIVKAAYKTGDVKSLENCLSELCALYEVENVCNTPMIEKKDDALFNWASSLAKGGI